MPPALSRFTTRSPERAVGSVDARHRVLERRDVRHAVEFELAFVPGFLIVEAVLFRDQPTFLLAVAVAAAAFLVLGVAWRRGARRRPHPTAFAVGVIIFAMGIAAGSTTEVIGSLMSGMFAVVVVGCAVWMPWSARWHGAFLLMSSASLALGLAVAPISATESAIGLLVGGSAIISSGLGAALVRRRHLRMWSQTIQLRREQASLRRTIADLEAAHGRIRRLEGILPICASCKRIRDGAEWRPVESYVAAHSEAQFSHGICPECAVRLYPAEAADLSRAGG